MKKILIIVLVLLFATAGILLFKVKSDIDNAKRYTNFITDSANEVLTKIEEINLGINEFEYSEEGENEVKDLSSNLTELEDIYNNILVEKEKVESHHGADEVEVAFETYLQKVDALIESYETMITSIEELEAREEFEAKLEDYIGKSNDLQEQSRVLEQKLNEFVEGYTNFDIKKVPDAIKNI